MNLRDLLATLTLVEAEGNVDIDISGIETDSRKVKPGDLFVALRGFSTDGHRFIRQAADNGAVAFLVEEKADVPGTYIKVADTKRALAVFADRFYGHPTQRLRVIGVTGTNGKTTVTHLLENILCAAGSKTGIIGTIEMRVGDYREPVANTTPESLQLQRMFSLMLEKGATHACIEVSSHALEMGRVWGCDFKTAVFTNLTQDHLDYHHTMDNYRHAKSLLFSQLGNTYMDPGKKIAVLNADDPASDYFRKVTSAEVITYGIDREADVRAVNISLDSTGTSFVLHTFKGSVPLRIRMVGKFSVYNALAAAAAALAEGVSLSVIRKSLEQVEGVAGRFERVDAGQDFTVIVDYAHTPDSLENVLQTAKEFTKGKLYCIVGCGGDRDRTKRPVMARIAAEYADEAIFTADNPRSEEPRNILQDMLSGVQDRLSKVTCIEDRKAAIEQAVSKAAKGDCILIAGKGHETYQIVKDQVLPFDDKQVALVAIQKRIK